jgi:hypothetical protein
VAGQNESTDQERLTFTAPSTGIYYIMVDTDDTMSPPPPGQFLLEVDHAGPAACSAGTRSCTGPTGDRISYCHATGLDSSQKTCAGTCSGGSCTQNPGDFCEDATPAVDGDSFTFGYTEFSDDYDLDQSGCVGYETSGNDRVFEVSMQPGETLTVSANSQNGNDWVQAYVVASCGDAMRVADSCQKGVDFGGSSGTMTFSPTIASETTYFVVIDGWLADTSGQVTVDVTIQ